MYSDWKIERQADARTDTDVWIDRQTGRKADSLTEKQTEKQTERRSLTADSQEQDNKDPLKPPIIIIVWTIGIYVEHFLLVYISWLHIRFQFLYNAFI